MPVGLLEPGFDLRVISLLALLVLHFAKQELSFQLFAWQFLYELYQAGFRLHESFEPRVEGLNLNWRTSSSLVLEDAIAIGLVVSARSVSAASAP
jgi:hypothetical protein